MDLTVRLFAALRERAGANELVLRDLPERLDIGALKREIEKRHPEIGNLSHVAGVVGTNYVVDSHRIEPRDEVSLLPPVSGGAPDAGDRVGCAPALRRDADPIASRRARASLLRDGDESRDAIERRPIARARRNRPAREVDEARRGRRA